MAINLIVLQPLVALIAGILPYHTTTVEYKIVAVYLISWNCGSLAAARVALG